ncbi:unnamed protein product [Lepidochelys olivacea]
MRSAPSPTRVREAPWGNGVSRLRGPPKMAVRLRGQRLMTFVHLFCFLWALFSLSQNVGLPHSLRRESENTYGGRWKYLTFINQILQTLLFGICVILDFACVFIPAKKNHVSSRLLPPRDFLFSVLVFPVGLFVAVTFWTLYAYDRELVYPKELDETTPSWLNHTMGLGCKLLLSTYRGDPLSVDHPHTHPDRSEDSLTSTGKPPVDSVNRLPWGSCWLWEPWKGSTNTAMMPLGSQSQCGETGLPSDDPVPTDPLGSTGFGVSPIVCFMRENPVLFLME